MTPILGVRGRSLWPAGNVYAAKRVRSDPGSNGAFVTSSQRGLVVPGARFRGCRLRRSRGLARARSQPNDLRDRLGLSVRDAEREPGSEWWKADTTVAAHRPS